MVEIYYNGQPVDNCNNMPLELQTTVMFWKNKLSAILGYFKDEIEACDGHVIISSNYNGRKATVIIEYNNISNDLETRIKSRLA